MSIKRQSAWNMAPQLVTAVTGFLSMPLFLRFLGDENYAVWNFAIIYAGVFGFADAGLGVAVGRFVGIALGRNDRQAVREYWGTGNAILLPFLVLAVLTLVGSGFWLAPKWYNVAPDHVGVLRACVAATGIGILFSYYSQYWNVLAQAHLDYKFIGAVQATTALLRVIPGLMLACALKNPFLVAAWYALISLVELIIFVRHGRNIYQLGLEFSAASRSRMREMSGYFGKNLIGLLVGSAFGQIDRQILGSAHLRASPADFAHYTVAGNLSMRLQGLSNAVMGPVFFNTARTTGGKQHTSTAAIFDEMFTFVLGWYFLAATWMAVWHPVFAHLWLGHTMGAERGAIAAAQVGPLLVPLVAACGFTAVANVSGAQLSSINRMGTTVLFSAGAGLLAVAGVWIGWRLHGVLGAAYGFLFSRLVFVAQDLFIIRLLKAKGWFGWAAWRQMVLQSLVSAIFAGSYFLFPVTSVWLLIPAVLHAGLISAWLLRHPLRKLFKN